MLTIHEPAQCPLIPSLDEVYLPPWDERINQNEIVDSYESLHGLDPILDNSGRSHLP